MKRFVFRLETLLWHREKTEEKERAQFSRIRGEMLQEAARRESLVADRDRTARELAGIRQCEAQEFPWCYRFLQYLGAEIKRCDERLAELGKKLDAQKQVMAAATRDKKMVANLKNKKEKEFRVTLDREEQKSIDDLVVTRFALK